MSTVRRSNTATTAAAPVSASRQSSGKRRALPNGGRLLSDDKRITKLCWCAPEGAWAEGLDEDGNTFWLNEETAEIVWVKPPEARIPFGLEEALCCAAARWQKFRCSREGRPFYVNAITGKKSWQEPPTLSQQIQDGFHRSARHFTHNYISVPAYLVAKPVLSAIRQDHLISPIMPGCDGKGMPLEGKLAEGRSTKFLKLFRMAQGGFYGDFQVEVATTEGDGFFRGTAPPREHVEKMSELIAPELEIYPAEFFSAAGLKRVVVAGKLAYGEQARVGTCDYTTGTLWMDSKPRQAPYLRSVFHHELFHLVDHVMELNRRRQNGGSERNDSEWDGLNYTGFQYGSGGHHMQHDHKCGLLGTADTPGFLNRYSTSAAKEDRAEVYAAMVCNPAAIKGDKILEKKAALLRRRIRQLCPAMEDGWFLERERVAEQRRQEAKERAAGQPPKEKEIVLEIEEMRQAASAAKRQQRSSPGRSAGAAGSDAAAGTSGGGGGGDGDDDTPAPWIKNTSTGGRPYWHNPETGESTWFPPGTKGAWVKLINEEGKQFYYNTLTGENSWTAPNGVTAASPKGPGAAGGPGKAGGEGGGEGEGWTSHVDAKTGKTFWHNKLTGETKWDLGGAGAPPRKARKTVDDPPAAGATKPSSSSSTPLATASATPGIGGGGWGGGAGGGSSAGSGGAAGGRGGAMAGGAGRGHWKEYFSKTYRKAYWYNADTKERTWIRPDGQEGA